MTLASYSGDWAVSRSATTPITRGCVTASSWSGAEAACSGSASDRGAGEQDSPPALDVTTGVMVPKLGMEPMVPGCSITNVRVRRLVSAVVAVAIVAAAGTAMAKGRGLRFEHDAYAPGEMAVGTATVHVWPGSGQPEDGPYAAYLVRGGQPLWFGHLPRTALSIGELDTRGLEPVRTDGAREAMYNVRFTFEVPEVRGGEYQVWVCRKECGSGSAFGDLVYGPIRIADADSADPAATAPKPTAPTSGSGGAPWLVIGLAAVGVVGAGYVVAGRRSRQLSRT